MADFVQLHLLTTYGPANLNRDDTGRPKSVSFGGVPRLRVSSQSLKRAWRESEVFEEALRGHLGERTRRLGILVRDHLLKGGMDEDAAVTAARTIVKPFGDLPKDNRGEQGKRSKETPSERERNLNELSSTRQLVFVSPEERSRVLALAQQVLEHGVESIEDDVGASLSVADTAADIAMFGRMLAGSPRFNREAAVQVAHAITTHRAVAEDDYYTAVDDLKSPDESDDAGAGFVNVQEFGAGVFYLYVCVNRYLLLHNLDGSTTVRDSSLAALVEAAATVSPRGKQASFASRASASYVLAEKGTAQPRSLAGAFLKPIGGDDFGQSSVAALEGFRDRLDAAYGVRGQERSTMDCGAGTGTLNDIIEFVVS